MRSAARPQAGYSVLARRSCSLRLLSAIAYFRGDLFVLADVDCDQPAGGWRLRNCGTVLIGGVALGVADHGNGLGLWIWRRRKSDWATGPGADCWILQHDHATGIRRRVGACLFLSGSL